MTHGRKPRQPRTRVQNPVRLAVWQAALLDRHQVEAIMTPLRLAFAALREGVTTELEWTYVVSAMNIADSVAITSRSGARAATSNPRNAPSTASCAAPWPRASGAPQTSTWKSWT